ncbi:MAG TPA: protein translocase subunit SecF [Candidatus Baltobacteraceae bacterium]|nr:protein translocase subunit SecF [Candidatus Baltobacteraceae bacterium]
MFFRRLNWNIVGWFRTVSLISYLIIAAGFGSMIYHGFAGGNGFQPSKMLQLGLSFTGGTAIDVTFTQPVAQQPLRAALASLGVTDAEVRTVGTENGNGWLRYNVEETQVAFGNNAQQLWDALNKLAPVDRSKSQITSVGPTLGREYLTKAVEALVIALGIQFLYIAFRFGWNYIFGLVTVVALVRDAAMMIGIYAMAGKKADDAFLAAVLTVIGYSVMDTIVILDRIRENTKLMVGESYEKIVNTSILQTMTRSFNTLATVVITLVALLALGGASLKNFAFALLVGICSGGYHSIFYSAPLVLVFRKRQLAAAARKRAAGLSADRTRTARAVAESRALGAHAGVAREDIVAARKARREKAKATRAPAPVVPARYKRKRTDGTSAGAASSTAVEDAPGAFEEIDPLDAQASGLHDAAFDQGHEAITLHLDEFEPEQSLPPRDEPAQPQGE